MRFLKKLLICIYGFLALFVVYCCVIFTIYQIEPTVLIAGVMAGVGVESILAGFIKFTENKAERKAEKEDRKERQEKDDTNM